MKKTAILGDENGLTFIEVIVSLMLLLLLAYYMLTVFTFSTSYINNVRKVTAANLYAVSIIETIKTRPELLNKMPIDNVVLEDLGIDIVRPQGMTAAVNMKPGSVNDYVYIVEVEVIWTEFSGSGKLKLRSGVRDGI